MRIIIIGASGNIGHQLYSDACARGLKVVGTRYRRNAPNLQSFDILTDSLEDLVTDLGSGDCVYLLSAAINPNLVFAKPKESRRLNVDAAIRTIDCAMRHSAKLVYVSTELVFSGETGGYVESAAPAPTTEYGRQKLEVEEYIRTMSGSWSILRTGATVSYREGDNCPVAKTFYTLMTEGAKMAVGNVFSLTDVRDTSRALLKLADREDNGIYHAVGQPPITRVGMANAIMEMSEYGSKMRFAEVEFDAIDYPEIRPRRSWLDSRITFETLGMSFSPPEKTVERKIAHIDKWFAINEKLSP